ncbi:hypothetical protein [Bradyrhizobium sp.]|jgi:hypothetical protein|uniref:hypothetical protein n=1 Tax=Bradyrhizobium sp. TaxID=376 RepID=UPI002DF7F4E4|nr:hypothetical protein [Bradyrhizobium sp.]
MSYPFDPDTRDYVARLLYDRIPALYKLADQRAAQDVSPHRPELEDFVRVLAGPLAVLRQSIEESYADLFIDSANDWILPYLADMVGTRLIFPESDANRRDVRGTVGWRRRKGTPRMLRDLGGDLTGELVVTQEGWKRVQLAQDLDLLRSERLVPDLRPPSIAERGYGPLDALMHAVDPRAISLRTGKYHPKHVVHWVHPTALFPLAYGTPADLTEAGDPDLRYAFHPLGAQMPLRCRATGADDVLATDRVPPMIFAESPGDWFGRDGRFDVRICGLSAAIGTPAQTIRALVRTTADPAILAGTVTLGLLEHDSRAFSGAVRVELAAVPFPGPNLPNIAGAQIRARLDISAAGAGPSVAVSVGAFPAGAIAMICLTAVGAVGRRFPGAVIEIASGAAGALLGATAEEPARDGFLRGALVVRLPPTRINGQRWFYLASDGSLFEAQSAATGAVDVGGTLVNGILGFDEANRRTVGPGPAWPPLPSTSDINPWPHLPAAPYAGPVVAHGGEVLRSTGPGVFAPVPAGTACALAFALSWFANGRTFAPMLRLSWTGSSPAAAVWAPLGDDGRTIDAGGDPITVASRFSALGAIVAEGHSELALAVRFECSDTAAVMTAGETAFTSIDGASVLIHAPDMAVDAVVPDPAWPIDPAFAAAGPSLSVGRDGSAWRTGTTSLRRRALGAVMPLRTPAALRRRRVFGRTLCGWRNEVPPLQMLAGTLPGRIDIDVAHGLFALALADPPQSLPQGPAGAPPPALSVAWQEGYSAHVGARSDAREPLLGARLPTPTRLVSASGALAPDAPATRLSLPVHRTLGEAFNAIAAAALPDEVIEFQDSSTYAAEALAWPATPQHLTVQAAERVRPVVIVHSWNAGAARYRSLGISGIAWHFEAAGDFAVPPADTISFNLNSVLRPDARLVFELTDVADRGAVTVSRSLTGGLQLASSGDLIVHDSVIDTGAGSNLPAIETADGELGIERATVWGAVNVRVLEASETIFVDDVTVEDRFHGCIRYSRVTGASITKLPRQHRLAVDTRVRFAALDRHNPAHARLLENCDRAVLAGAEDGGEMGAFHDTRLAQIYEAYRRRLIGYTPAGLVSGVVRLD